MSMKQAVIAMAVLAAAPQAASASDSNFSISGFGTLAAAQSDTDDVKYVRYNQKEGVGDSPRIGLDSNLGLQATYTLTPDLSATMQVLVRKSTSQHFGSELSWGFLKYQLDDEINVRAGRMVLPAFLISDYQNVGYANTMMRPPVEVYSQEPLENMDGADINWQHDFGSTNLAVQAFAGQSSGKLFVPSMNAVGHYRAPLYGLSVMAERGPLTLRASHMRAKVKAADLDMLNRLTDVLTRYGYADLADGLTLRRGKHMSFTSVGMTADWNNVVLQSEYAWRRAQDPASVPQTNSWYTMAGYRIGKVLPYYAHARFYGGEQKLKIPGDLPPKLARAVYSLAAPAAQRSDLIGMRWDFAKSMTLKLQWDRVKPTAKTGSLIYGPAVYRDTVNVAAAGIDFVF